MKKLVTVYECDVNRCGTEIKGLADGLILLGSICSADGETQLSTSEFSGEGFAICWRHFHEKFPSPQIRDYERRLERDDYIPRGGPGDR